MHIGSIFPKTINTILLLTSSPLIRERECKYFTIIQHMIYNAFVARLFLDIILPYECIIPRNLILFGGILSYSVLGGVRANE